MYRFVCLAALIILLLFNLGLAEVPQLINYQGMLTTTGGSPVTDGSYNLTFKIYGSESEDDSLWWEIHSGVTVSNGLFNVMLGSTNSIPDSVFTDSVRYLGITVESDPELSPRSRFTSVPYAYRAATAEPDSDWEISGSDMYSTVSGNVGIGTTSPGYKLDVDGDIQASGYLRGSTFGLYFSNLGKIQTGNGNLNLNAVNGNLLFSTNGNERIRIDLSGNVGVGLSSPGEKLDVSGTVQMTGFKMTTGATDGYVLTSDASGVGTWQAGGGGGNNDWAFLITDTADTTLITGGAWGIARSGNTLYGSADSTHVNLGVACTTGNSGSNVKYCTVGGGYLNTASYNHTTVGGGQNNTASDLYATVGGGTYNTASNDAATVSGGSANTASQAYSTVGGGDSNTAGAYSATVAGGEYNTASNDHATVGGGFQNTASQFNATVSGGYQNTASANYSFVGGGYANTAGDRFATVGGGMNNSAADSFTTVAGGRYNTASENYATVGGGCDDTASGEYATVPGGRSNTASGNYSFAAGRKARASHQGTFVWADSTDANFTSTGDNQFLIRASGGVGIGTDSPQGALDVSSTTGGFIVPRMTTVQRDALTAVNGMIIYNTTTNQFNFYENDSWVTK